jgi:hypothetical protein
MVHKRHRLTLPLVLLLHRQGIGVPAVATLGTIAANTLTTVKAPNQLMKELRAQGDLQPVVGAR